MEPLRDASHLLHHRDALVARLSADGYLFLPSLIPNDEVEPVRREVSLALASEGWLAPGSDPIDGRPAPIIRHEGEPHFWGGYCAVQRLESFHRLAHHRSVLEVMEAILGGEVLVHPRKIARATFPGDAEYTTPPHQDFRTIQGTADVLTAWVPLLDCPRELGGLRVLATGPAADLLPVTPAKGAGGMTTGVPNEHPAWRGGDYRQGDVLVFHSLTIHGGLPNRSDRLRLSVDFRYQRADEPITPLSLLPHHHPDIPAWDELTRGWSMRQWVDASPRRVVEVQQYDAEIPVPASRLLGRALSS